MLRRKLWLAVWHGKTDARSIAFSPFLSSCVCLSTASNGTRVVVEWFREGPRPLALSRAVTAEGYVGSTLQLLGWVPLAVEWTE